MIELAAAIAALEDLQAARADAGGDRVALCRRLGIEPLVVAQLTAKSAQDAQTERLGCLLTGVLMGRADAARSEAEAT